MTTLPETKACKVNIENEWLTISFNQPEKRNALTSELTDDIKNIFDAARDDLGVRGVTMRGEGGIFCAGGDLKMFKTCLLYTSPSPRDRQKSRMPSSA